MINEDNACIRYLMKEMDPSEEMLMERAMMEDDDLLIEVECMRQTLKRLDKLPKVDPPAHLRDSIVKEAVEHRKKVLSSSGYLPSFSSSGIKYAAAALVVIGSTVGGILFYNDETSTPSEDPAQLTSAEESSITSPDVLQNVQAIQTSTGNSSAQERLDPWVDKNDIIYFQDHYNKDNTGFESLIKSTTEKLTPLNDSFIFNTGTPSLQLTGSSRTNQ